MLRFVFISQAANSLLVSLDDLLAVVREFLNPNASRSVGNPP